MKIGTVYRKFEIKGTPEVVIPVIDVDPCAEITPISIPELQYGKPVYEWVDEDDLNKAIAPYRLPISPMMTTTNNQITGVPSIVQPARTVTAKIKD